MAKLIDIYTEDETKKRIQQTLVLVLCVSAFIFAAFLHEFIEDKKSYEEDTYTKEIFVHVKGAVNNSGLYSVPWGTRVCDLEEYVGGFKENVLLDGVNLAAYVNDGEEIYFPYEGSREVGAINLNKVTAEELAALVEGVGDESARKIIAYRNANGGFTSVLELDSILGKTKAQKLYKYFYVEK